MFFVVDNINIKISNKKVCLMKADVEETVSWICFLSTKMLQVLGKKVIGLVAWDKTFGKSRRASVQPQYSPYQQSTFCYLDNMN
jgi:hypothetical protein